MTHLSPARRYSPSLRSAAHSRVAQTYRPDPVRPGRVALRRNRWRTTMQLGNGTTRAYAYDANSRLTTQIELNGSTRLVTIVDSYDPVGNRIGRNLDGVLTTWTYDDLYRLTHQDKPGQVCTYVLDPVGNLEVMWEGGANPKSFTFDAADRLVTMVEGSGTTTFTYTGYGALEVTVDPRGTRTTNTYDGQDQLIKVQRAGGGVIATTSTYTFDGDGMRRTAQEGNVQPTTMVWDGSDYLFLDGPSSDQLVLTLDGEIVACGSKDLLTDPLGSLVREISTGASLSSAFSFAPYGTPLSGAPTIPFRYIAAYGYYFDTNDRDYVRARELEKRLGRWMQTDPLWPQERAFGYVRNHPLTLSDPSGAEPAHCYCKPRVRAQNVPCPNCQLFPTPQAGWPIGKKPETRQECFNFACASWCMSEQYADDLQKRCKTDPSSVIRLLPACTKANPYFKECDHWCDKGAPGTGCNESNDPPISQLFGNHCAQECNKRVCCHLGPIEKKRNRELQKEFADCIRLYRYKP